MPSFELLLDDVGGPRAAAAYLGVCKRSIRRWQTSGKAPRLVLLALSWVSRWGQSAIACEAHNDAVMYAGMVRCLQEELRDQVARKRWPRPIPTRSKVGKPATWSRPSARATARPSSQKLRIPTLAQYLKRAGVK
ncbi:hypothetical protein ASC67_02710 [Methylibium sp. Root1272]|nr:hypothetical protein ASC67_02710 [Methylibium sp. Root1272]